MISQAEIDKILQTVADEGGLEERWSYRDLQVRFFPKARRHDFAVLKVWEAYGNEFAKQAASPRESSAGAEGS